MAASTSSTIAVTGANGFLGLALVQGLLSRGYSVRAIARREEGIQDVRSVTSLQHYLNAGILQTKLVRDDSLAASSYTEAFKGVSHVIHTAAPLLFVPGDHVAPALKLTQDILAAVEATPSVSRLIFTGSLSSIKPWQRLLRPGHPAYTSSESTENAPVLTSSTTWPTPDPSPSHDAPPFEHYTAGKIAVHNHLLHYAASHPRAQFSVVTILPGMILGEKLTAKDKRAGMMCSNSMLAFLFRPFPQGRWIGGDADAEIPMLSEVVAMSDAVEAHIRALDVQVQTGSIRNFFLSGSWKQGLKWEEADEVAKALYPEAVSSGGIRIGSAPGKMISAYCHGVPLTSNRNYTGEDSLQR